MADDPTLAQVQGEIVAKSFAPAFVVLSYMVSWVGAWTSLELLNKRTAGRGLYNWYLLIGSSITEGGISIWSMHFLANRAIVLGDGRDSLQISYSSVFTALSFFVPTVVLLGAFITTGSNERVSWLRVGLGGALAGASIAGMHFVAQAGVSNYSVEYEVINVVGSGVLAVVATIAALTVFFVLRATWTASWWKRALIAVLLAGAASAMHWLAEVGTHYRLRSVGDHPGQTLSPNSTIVIVILLSVSSCVLLLSSSLLAQRRRALSADRAQQVVLAAAIFDKDGRLMVTPEGRLPSQKITNSFIERSFDDVFGISHPVFLWIFRITRNWDAIATLLPLMRSHINYATLPKGNQYRTGDPNLDDDSGEPTEDYSFIFRQLFCVAASDLADQMNESLEQVGVLYDGILRTGQVGTITTKSRSKRSSRSSIDVEMGGLEPQYYGRGQLLFLTRQANQREVENLQNSGFRFAGVRNVVDILARSMQISTDELSAQLGRMRDYPSETQMLEPGIHISYFAIRANIRGGFDILVRKNARSQLPTKRIQLSKLDDWHVDYLSKLDGMSASGCLNLLKSKSTLPNLSEREANFIAQLQPCLEAFGDDIRDPTFLDSLLVSRPLSVPCRGAGDEATPGQASMIAFRHIVPIHSRAPNDQFEFIPLSLFKAQQQVYPNSPGHAVFGRRMHREFAPILNQSRPSLGDTENGLNSPSSFNLKGSQSVDHVREELEYRMPTLIPRAKLDNRKPLRFWGKNLELPPSSGSRSGGSIRDDASSENNLVETTSFGGILVSQEITVDIQEVSLGAPELGKSAHVEMVHSPVSEHFDIDEKTRMGTLGVASTETEDPETYVNILFAICKESR